MNKTTKIIAIAVLVLVVGNVAFARSLTIGSTGSDVVSLQTFLIENGYTIPLIEKGVANKGYFGEQTSNAVKMYQEDNEIEPNGVIDSESYSVKNATPILGAVSGPDNFLPYFAVNGVKTFYYNQSINPAASTTCSFRLPLGATTTLVSASASFNRIASTSVFEIGYSAINGFSTTTLIAQKAITTATQDTIVATSTFGWGLGALTPPYTFAPGAYINYKLGSGAVAGTVTPLGQCKLVVRGV